MQKQGRLEARNGIGKEMYWMFEMVQDMGGDMGSKKKWQGIKTRQCGDLRWWEQSWVWNGVWPVCNYKRKTEKNNVKTMCNFFIMKCKKLSKQKQNVYCLLFFFSVFVCFLNARENKNATIWKGILNKQSPSTTSLPSPTQHIKSTTIAYMCLSNLHPFTINTPTFTPSISIHQHSASTTHNQYTNIHNPHCNTCSLPF